MGIPDHESWLLREYAPTGHASGWRRLGCFVMLITTCAVLLAAGLLGLLLGR